MCYSPYLSSPYYSSPSSPPSSFTSSSYEPSPRTMNVTDVASTWAKYLKNVDIPANSVGRPMNKMRYIRNEVKVKQQGLAQLWHLCRNTTKYCLGSVYNESLKDPRKVFGDSGKEEKEKKWGKWNYSLSFNEKLTFKDYIRALLTFIMSKKSYNVNRVKELVSMSANEAFPENYSVDELRLIVKDAEKREKLKKKEKETKISSSRYSDFSISSYSSDKSSFSSSLTISVSEARNILNKYEYFVNETEKAHAEIYSLVVLSTPLSDLHLSQFCLFFSYAFTCLTAFLDCYVLYVIINTFRKNLMDTRRGEEKKRAIKEEKEGEKNNHLLEYEKEIMDELEELQLEDSLTRQESESKEKEYNDNITTSSTATNTSSSNSNSSSNNDNSNSTNNNYNNDINNNNDDVINNNLPLSSSSHSLSSSSSSFSDSFSSNNSPLHSSSMNNSHYNNSEGKNKCLNITTFILLLHFVLFFFIFDIKNIFFLKGSLNEYKSVDYVLKVSDFNVFGGIFLKVLKKLFRCIISYTILHLILGLLTEYRKFCSFSSLSSHDRSSSSSSSTPSFFTSLYSRFLSFISCCRSIFSERLFQTFEDCILLLIYSVFIKFYYSCFPNKGIFYRFSLDNDKIRSKEGYNSEHMMKISKYMLYFIIIFETVLPLFCFGCREFKRRWERKQRRKDIHVNSSSSSSSIEEEETLFDNEEKTTNEKKTWENIKYSLSWITFRLWLIAIFICFCLFLNFKILNFIKFIH